jgi:hypothetical protein
MRTLANIGMRGSYKYVRRAVAFSLLLSACTHPAPEPPPPPPARPAADFALRFDHKGCHYEYLDTFQRTYSHVGPHPRVPFALSGDQRNTLFAAVVAADFFNWPADLGESRQPSSNYEIEVQNAGRRHAVRMSIESRWLNAELRRSKMNLLTTIYKVLENHPDVLRLPRRGDGCSAGPPEIR